MNYKLVGYFLGRILVIEAVLLALPLAVELIYREGEILSFVIPMVLLFILGFALSFKQPVKKDMYVKEGFVIVGLSWILISAFGALPFVIGGSIPSYIDALFETVSGFTTTGASILTEIEGLPKSILFWRSFTHWIGGMGVLVFVLALLPKTGEMQSMYIMKAEVPGPTVSKLVSKTRVTARILYGLYIGLTLIEVVFLLFGGMSVFDSFVHSFGTAGTGGFSSKNLSIAAFDSAYIDIVITVFMALFGVNFNIFYLILAGHFIQALKSEEFKVYVGILITSILAIAVNILPLYENFGTALRYSSFQVSSIMTTTGYATADFAQWPVFSQLLLVLLMFIGASSGSTGGGLKVMRVVRLFKVAISEIKKTLKPRSVGSVKLDGKKLEPDVIRGVPAYFAIYILVFVFSVILISFESFDNDTVVTSVIACLNNIGPGLSAVGPLGNYSAFSILSKSVLIFDMLAGRLEIFPILMIFSPATWRRTA